MSDMEKERDVSSLSVKSSKDPCPHFSQEHSDTPEKKKRSDVSVEEQPSCCASCQNVLKDPVSTSCGHWFCRQCITSYWDQSASSGDSSCPQCGEKSRAGLQIASQTSTVQNKSMSKTNLDVSEDRRKESVDEEDQLCPDDPEKSKLHLNTNGTLSFTPELRKEHGKTSYRFRCPGPGVFQCALTGLVFVMAQEAELLYNTAIWDEIVLQSSGKMPAGPLFKITCSEDAAVSQLHLPHCETKEALLIDGLLSVVHISDDGMSFLKPLKITDTHVIVKVPHLCAIGLIWNYIKRLLNFRLPINGQVVLFLRPPGRSHQVLDVLLLPSNVPLTEVISLQRSSRHINIAGNCHFIFGQSYSVHCEPEDFKSQPEREQFRADYGPNYHPTFEVFLTTTPEKLTLMVQDQECQNVWKRDMDLRGQGFTVLQQHSTCCHSLDPSDGMQYNKIE